MMPSESAYGKISQEALCRFASIVLCFRQYAARLNVVGWRREKETHGRVPENKTNNHSL